MKLFRVTLEYDCGGEVECIVRSDSSTDAIFAVHEATPLLSVDAEPIDHELVLVNCLDIAL